MPFAAALFLIFLASSVASGAIQSNAKLPDFNKLKNGIAEFKVNQ